MRWMFHSFMPVLSHYSALSIVPLTCVVTTDHRRHPDQLAASACKATTTNSLIIITALQHLHVPIVPHTRTPCAYNGQPRAQTAPWNRAFCKQSKEPTSVFHVSQNPEISVGQADLHTGFLKAFLAAQRFSQFLFCGM